MSMYKKALIIGLFIFAFINFPLPFILFGIYSFTKTAIKSTQKTNNNLMSLREGFQKRLYENYKR